MSGPEFKERTEGPEQNWAEILDSLSMQSLSEGIGGKYILLCQSPRLVSPQEEMTPRTVDKDCTRDVVW